MQIFKKMLALALALTLVFALVACSDSKGKTDIFETTQAGAKKPETTEAKVATTVATTEAPTTMPETTEAVTTEATEPETTQPAGKDGVFAAIGNPEIDASLVGTWSYVMDFGKLMESAMAEETGAGTGTEAETSAESQLIAAMMSAFDGITMEMVMDLRADGSFTFGMDEESTRAAMETMIPKLGEVMFPLIASMSGMTVEDLEAELQKQGYTKEAYMEQIMGSMDLEEMVDEIKASNQEGAWRFADGKLYLVEEGETVDPEKYMSVEPGNGVLTVTSVPADSSDAEMYDALLPMVFTRK